MKDIDKTEPEYDCKSGLCSCDVYDFRTLFTHEKHPLLIPVHSGALSSQAATVVITPTSVAYTTSPNQEENGIAGSLNNETRIIDGSGLSAIPTLATVSTVTHAAVNLAGSGSANAWATVDTGAPSGDFYV